MNDDQTFANWHAYYRDKNGDRATLALRLHPGTITLITHTGDHLNFTLLETGLFLDGLAAALRASGSIP